MASIRDRYSLKTLLLAVLIIAVSFHLGLRAGRGQLNILVDELARTHAELAAIKSYSEELTTLYCQQRQRQFEAHKERARLRLEKDKERARLRLEKDKEREVDPERKAKLEMMLKELSAINAQGEKTGGK